MNGLDPYFPLDTMQGIHGKHRDIASENNLELLTAMDRVAELTKCSIEKSQGYMRTGYDAAFVNVSL